MSSEKVLITRFPLESAWGGEEALHILLAEELRSRDVKVSYAGSCSVFQKEFKKQDFAVFRIPFIRDITNKKMLFLSPIVLPIMMIVGFFFLGYLRLRGYTTVIFLSYIEKISWTLSAKIFGFQVFWGHHAPLENWFFLNPYRFIWHAFAKSVPSIVPSHYMSRVIKGTYPNAKTCVLPNPLLPNRDFSHRKPSPDDREFFQKHFSLSSIPRDSLLVGSMGRLSKEKGIEDFLEAIKLLQKSPMQFFIAGKGPLQRSLQESVQKEGLQKKVHFLGFLEEKSLEIFLSGIDLFVLPSRQETFGMSAVEAMSAGLPIIATRVGGIPEVVTDGKNGILVEEKNPVAIAEAIQTLFHHPEKREALGKEGLEMAKNQFSVEMYADRAMQILFSSVPEKKQGPDYLPKKKKILWIENGDFLGGAERFSMDILKSGVFKKNDMTLLHGGDNAEFQEALSEVPKEYIKSERFYLPPLRKLTWPSLRHFRKAIVSFKKRVRLEKTDLVHANTARGILLVGAAFMTLPKNVHFTVFVHDFTLPRWTVRLFLRRADKIFACSELVKKDLEKKGCPRRKILVIPNGIPEELFDLPDPEFLDGKLRIGIIGRIDRWKGQDIFLLAAKQLCEKFPEADFFIIGSSSSHDQKTVDFEASLRRTLQEEGFSGRVHLMGFLSTREALSMLDVVVHAASEPEPFGRVPFEAAAAGRALVVSNMGTPGELFSDRENVLFFQAKNADDLAKKLEELLRNPSLAQSIAKNGRSFAEGYMLSSIAPKFSQAVQAVMERKAK